MLTLINFCSFCAECDINTETKSSRSWKTQRRGIKSYGSLFFFCSRWWWAGDITNDGLIILILSIFIYCKIWNQSRCKVSHEKELTYHKSSEEEFPFLIVYLPFLSKNHLHWSWLLLFSRGIPLMSASISLKHLWMKGIF